MVGRLDVVPCGCDIFLDIRIEPHDVPGDVLEAIAPGDVLDDLTELRSPDPTALPQLVDHQSPSVEAVEHVGLLECRSGLSSEGEVEEAPEGLTQAEHVEFRRPDVADLLADHGRGDLLGVHLLGPVDDSQEDTALGADIASDRLPPFLACGTVAALVLEELGAGGFLVKELRVVDAMISFIDRAASAARDARPRRASST